MRAKRVREDHISPALSWRRGPFAQSLVTLLAVSVMAATVSGCWLTGGGGKKAAQAVDVVLPQISRGLHWAGEVAPAGGTLSEVARGLGTALDTGTSIRAQFAKIAASDDPYGKALATATCYGLSNVASQYRQNNNVLPASAQTWEAFLNNAVRALLRPEFASQISARVTQFDNAAQLASIQPRVAYLYVRECALRPS
jgi:hypothetical protein